MEITYYENELTAKDFCRLRKEAGWIVPGAAQAEKALQNSLYTVCAEDKGIVIGMGRLVGDGALDYYIQDLIVSEDYQGRGIGKRIVEKLLEFVKSDCIDGASVIVALFSAQGRESFYKKAGFIERPNEHQGPGMWMRILKE